MCIFTFAHLHIHVSPSLSLSIHIQYIIYIHIYIHVHIYIHINIYIHIHTYIYIYIYTYGEYGIASARLPRPSETTTSAGGRITPGALASASFVSLLLWVVLDLVNVSKSS